MNIFFWVRLHKSLVNIKIAQVKIQFARYCCQQPNTRHSNSGRKQFPEINVHSLLIPPRYISRLDFCGTDVLISFPIKNLYCIDVAFHCLLRRLKNPRIQQLIQLPTRQTIIKMSVLGWHSLLVAPWYLEVRGVTVWQVRLFLWRPLVAQGHVYVLSSGEHCRHSSWDPRGPLKRWCIIVVPI